MPEQSAPKPWYQSKTIWVNVAVASLAAVEAATGALKPALGDNGVYAIIAAGLPLANMILRVMTSQPLGKPSDEGSSAP